MLRRSSYSSIDKQSSFSSASSSSVMSLSNPFLSDSEAESIMTHSNTSSLARRRRNSSPLADGIIISEETGDQEYQNNNSNSSEPETHVEVNGGDYNLGEISLKTFMTETIVPSVKGMFSFKSSKKRLSDEAIWNSEVDGGVPDGAAKRYQVKRRWGSR
ncbi:UNVERIFIED_CONTAM: hypothetical protein HDU68_010484 [Siphonaria sp. JEL0065]|nr:hypothetical protein HDU68_010484 [Siphonaria sp. JEL0065]